MGEAALLELGDFLLNHADTIAAVKEALESGRTKAQIMAAIRGTAVAASDAIVEAELGPRPT